jgi:uncharacterized protein (TIGR03437 family)
MPSFLALVLALAALGRAEFNSLATTDRGEQVFFVTSLRQTDTSQTPRRKIFALDDEGLQLLFEPATASFFGPFRPSEVTVSGDGSLVGFDVATPCVGGSSCFLRELSNGYLLNRGTGDRTRPGPHLRISRNGRYSLIWSSRGAMGASPAAITDRATGQTRTIEGVFPREGRIASDGSALSTTFGWLIHVDPVGIIRRPVESPGAGHGFGGISLSDSGELAVYETMPRRRLFVLDVATSVTAQLGPDDRMSYGATLSNDGEWVLYISVIGETPQLFFSRPDGSAWRQLTASAEGVAEAAVSGDGRVAWVSTMAGRLLKIDTASGEISEILAPPILDAAPGWITPGSLMHLNGRRLGTKVRIGDHEAHIVAADDKDVFAQVPWELPAPEQQPSSLSISVARGDSPLETATPEYTLNYATYHPAAFIEPVHEDWSGFITPESPARPGEVIHVYATGLGPVDCTISTGAPAPLDRLCRPTTPIEWDYWWTETDSVPAEVLFAGLAPGLVGLYQIEARVPWQPPASRLKLIANRAGDHVVADFMVR